MECFGASFIPSPTLGTRTQKSGPSGRMSWDQRPDWDGPAYPSIVRRVVQDYDDGDVILDESFNGLSQEGKFRALARRIPCSDYR